MTSQLPEIQTYELRYIGPDTEISKQFLQGMLNRMSVSYHKYGSVTRPGMNDRIDVIQCALQRIELYLETGNSEGLIDAANFLMIRHHVPLEGDFFKATDSDGSPGLVTVDGDVVKPATPEETARIKVRAKR